MFQQALAKLIKINGLKLIELNKIYRSFSIIYFRLNQAQNVATKLIYTGKRIFLIFFINSSIISLCFKIQLKLDYNDNYSRDFI